MQILEKIRKTAEASPERIAYRIRDSVLTYGVLWEQAGALAAALAADPRSRVVLYGEKEPEMLIGMLGCLLAGKTYVPISAGAPAQHTRRILDQIAPCVILAAGQSSVPGAVTISRLISSADIPLDPLPSGNPAPAYMIFTSGTTGIPKGVVVGRESLDHFASWIGRLEGLSELPAPARVWNQAEFSFDLSVADLYYALCGGHTLIGLPPELTSRPDELQRLLEARDPHVIVCTPTFLKLCLLDRSFCRNNLPALRVVYSCGERLEKKTAARLLERFPGLCLLNAYGPTEATSAVCAVRITEDMLNMPELLPVGRMSTAACEIEITEDEIVLKGESVSLGYFNGISGGFFRENGNRCYRTGDLGRIEGDLLYCCGRRDRQVKWKGYRIELDGIEQAIQEISGVSACAVTVSRNEEGSVRLIRCFVCLEPECSLEGLREELNRRLPAYQIPKAIRVLDRMPMTANGKLDRRRLEDL